MSDKRLVAMDAKDVAAIIERGTLVSEAPEDSLHELGSQAVQVLGYKALAEFNDQKRKTHESAVRTAQERVATFKVLQDLDALPYEKQGMESYMREQTNPVLSAIADLFCGPADYLFDEYDGFAHCFLFCVLPSILIAGLSFIAVNATTGGWVADMLIGAVLGFGVVCCFLVAFWLLAKTVLSVFHERVWENTEIKLYKEPIPHDVLNLAITIKERLPEAQLVINALVKQRLPYAINVPRIPLPDPFLGIQLGDETFYVRVWDELKFKPTH